MRRILMENGEVFEAKVFLDCTYEADLAALAGAAGVLSPDAPAAGGDASFTLCLTARPDNQVPFPKPPRYDADRYLPVLELLAREAGRLGRPLRMDEALIIRPLPGGKVLASHLPLGGYLGAGRDYLAADYGRRAQIWQEHIDYTAGLYYFLANDPRMPGSLREETGRFGLAADEFAYGNHWPHQLYIRESRPPGAELENLLVPAWLAGRLAPAGGLRGEVLLMTLGQLAGAAAKSLIDGGVK